MAVFHHAEDIERDLFRLGLSDAAREELRSLVWRPARRAGYVAR